MKTSRIVSGCATTDDGRFALAAAAITARIASPTSQRSWRNHHGPACCAASPSLVESVSRALALRRPARIPSNAIMPPHSTVTHRSTGRKSACRRGEREGIGCGRFWGTSRSCVSIQATNRANAAWDSGATSRRKSSTLRIGDTRRFPTRRNAGPGPCPISIGSTAPLSLTSATRSTGSQLSTTTRSPTARCAFTAQAFTSTPQPWGAGSSARAGLVSSNTTQPAMNAATASLGRMLVCRAATGDSLVAAILANCPREIN